MPSRRDHAPKPLYRRVNTRTHGVCHGHGGEARWDRNSKAGRSDERPRGSMHPGQRRGLDYTPLFRFLLSKVGEAWDGVHSEALSRLDREDPIWWLVARGEDDRRDVVRVGESTYRSGLYVDDAGCLAIVAPEVTVETLEPSCACCTHTFNGVASTWPYRPDWE